MFRYRTSNSSKIEMPISHEYALWLKSTPTAVYIDLSTVPSNPPKSKSSTSTLISSSKNLIPSYPTYHSCQHIGLLVMIQQQFIEEYILPCTRLIADFFEMASMAATSFCCASRISTILLPTPFLRPVSLAENRFSCSVRHLSINIHLGRAYHKINMCQARIQAVLFNFFLAHRFSAFKTKCIGVANR